MIDPGGMGDMIASDPMQGPDGGGMGSLQKLIMGLGAGLMGGGEGGLPPGLMEKMMELMQRGGTTMQPPPVGSI